MLDSKSSCPKCQHTSLDIHSKYFCTIYYVPTFSHETIIHLKVHKFFYREFTCTNKTFCESLSFMNPMMHYLYITSKL